MKQLGIPVESQIELIAHILAFLTLGFKESLSPEEFIRIKNIMDDDSIGDNVFLKLKEDPIYAQEFTQLYRTLKKTGNVNYKKWTFGKVK